MKPPDTQKPSIITALKVELCAERAVEFNSRTYRPDRFKGYLVFELAHAFPAGITIDHISTHPQVLANSYASMFNQVFDISHIIKSYNPDENSQDWNIGSIVDVEFPPTPEGGWKVQADPAKAPAVRGLAVLHKQISGVPQIMSEHLSGKRTWTVSLERDYWPSLSGFVAGPKTRKMLSLSDSTFTPPDLRAIGYEYFPNSDPGTAALWPCWDWNEMTPIASCMDSDLCLLVGGLDGEVEFKGVGLTPLGKEADAEVLQMVAGEKDAMLHAGQILAGLTKLAARL